MSTMSSAVHGVLIGNRRIRTGVGVPDEIRSEGDFESFAEAAAESRVKIINSGVNDSNLDPLSINAYQVSGTDLG